MKQNYFFAFCLSVLLSSSLFSQTVSQIYDHDTSNLTKIYNMPFDQTRLLVLEGSGYNSSESIFNEFTGGQLVPMVFSGVNAIYGTPEMKDDKILFIADINSIGKELAIFDGTSTDWIDFNANGDSDPELISYGGEIFVIANNGIRRQLYKYLGGTSFLQISDQIDADVEEFIGELGTKYYYVIYDVSFGSTSEIRETIDPQGAVSHSDIFSILYQSSISPSVQINGNIYFINSIYTFTGTDNYVLEIDATGTLSIYYSLITTGPISFGTSILIYDNKLLFYSSDPSNNSLIELTGMNQSSVFVQLSGYNLTSHVVANGELLMFGNQLVLEVSTGAPNVLFNSLGTIIPGVALTTSEAVYIYDYNTMVGSFSKVYEIELANFNVIEYNAVIGAGYSFSDNAAVEHDGNIKFLFRETEQGDISSDIYSLNSILTVEENNFSEFNIYPNPSSDGTFFVSLPENGVFTIRSMDGRLIKSVELLIGVTSFAIEDFVSGAYFVEYKGQIQRLIIN